MKTALIAILAGGLLGLSVCTGPSVATAMELTLTTPITQPSMTTLHVTDITDKPLIKRINIRLVLGYKRGRELVEVQSFEKEVNEPQYSALQDLIRTSGKSIEEIVLNRMRAEYPGTVQ